MPAKIIGIIWAISGFIWILKPEMLKNRLKKKMSRKTTRIVFIALLFFGIVIFSSLIKVSGIVPKTGAVAGLVITFKAILLLISKSTDKLIAWSGKKSISFFRISAALIMIFGVIMCFSVK